MIKQFRISFDEIQNCKYGVVLEHYCFGYIDSISIRDRVIEFTDIDGEHYCFYLSKLRNLQIEEQ